ncbi:hypothetical protein CDES_10395 [Corynebacterium deserti GIMN1.010]|uniref:Uncharacterized protein n=1 Tax=Corynebacterium deserti GIMN1.010 TaxID=931089 RepID=A0A0M5IGF2_9CORY|nr:hypothetical protein [Corynebacterium deserti]ALC06456.1 hypothetical protein CDES_10395 [Corynebacterium deserti GIMN1.010]
MSTTEIQFNWTGQTWERTEVGAEVGPDTGATFALGVMEDFAYIAAIGSEGDEEFFTLGSNPGLTFGDPEWLFAQDNPQYVVDCMNQPAGLAVVDKYLSRLSDEQSRGEPIRILNELVSAMGLPALPW